MLPTPWFKFLLQKLILSKVLKKFPIFYGNLWFSIVVKETDHLSIFWPK